MSTRLEKDSLGEKAVPADAYWGIHTQRAMENFPVSGRRFPGRLVRAMALVKKACCLANLELGYLDRRLGQALGLACEELAEGKLADQFPLDAFQGGAGTSFNMNVNEVLANRAIEILGGRKGDYGLVHPLETVNRHQSTNDTFPTALKIASILAFRELSQTVARLQGACQRKEKEFAEVIKIGRTELQEAVPITLGAEFAAFAEAFARDRWRFFKAEERLRVVNLGGTAVGTGLGAPRAYIFLVIEKLRELTGLGLCRGEITLDPTANSDPFVEVSGMLKAHSVNLLKVCNDLRLLNLLGEIRLPAVQVGSSIMPGKVNPVILESAMQAALQVQADDFLVTEAAGRASLQINEFLPLLAQAMLGALEMLGNAGRMLTGHLEGIEADPERCLELLVRSETLITAFLPRLGYERAGALLREFVAGGGRDLRAFLEERLGRETVARTLSAYNLTALGHREDEKDA